MNVVAPLAFDRPLTGAWSNAAHNAYTGKTQDVFNWYMYITDNFN
ncbi:hypothetical protein [Microbacterium marinum]